jgi:hypothetical protein
MSRSFHSRSLSPRACVRLCSLSICFSACLLVFSVPHVVGSRSEECPLSSPPALLLLLPVRSSFSLLPSFLLAPLPPFLPLPPSVYLLGSRSEECLLSSSTRPAVAFACSSSSSPRLLLSSSLPFPPFLCAVPSRSAFSPSFFGCSVSALLHSLESLRFATTVACDHSCFVVFLTVPSCFALCLVVFPVFPLALCSWQASPSFLSLSRALVHTHTRLPHPLPSPSPV